MEKCKFCQADLEEGNPLCPACGKDNRAEAQERSTEEMTAQQESSAEKAVQPPEEEPASPSEMEQSSDEKQNPSSGEKSTPELSAPIQEGASPGRIALAVAGVVVLLAVLIGLVVAGLGEDKAHADSNEAVPTNQSEPAESTPEPTEEPTVVATVPADGNPDDVTCKGSYSASEEELLAQKDQVVASIGDRKLTNGQLQVYYQLEFQSFLSNYGAYAYYFGLDYTQPLDTQKSMEESGITWQQFFLQDGLKNWQQVQAMAAEAEKAGLEIPEAGKQVLEELESTIEELAQSYEMTVEELMKSNFGPGAGFEEYRYFQEQYCKSLAYYEQATANLVPQEEDLKAFFEEHREDYENSGVTEDDRFVDVRHILVTVKGGTTDDSGKTVYTEEEWETCCQEAQAILDEWLSGDANEDSFGALATERTEDPGSQESGGLYKKVYEGQMVPEFNDWCFDESRVYGDYGLVRTDYGYHVMFFVSSMPQWRAYAERDWVTDQTNKMMDALLSSYPMEVDYGKILLGALDITG